ncbi:MAG: ATP-binding protein [Planctomycetota bacterium]
MAYLRALTGEGATYEIDGETTIGRDRDNTIRLLVADTSRRHAVIRPTDDGGFEIEDMGSTLGTEVGGRRVTAPQRLEDGDRITLGSAVLRFTVDVPSEADDPPIDVGEYAITTDELVGYKTVPLSRMQDVTPEAAAGPPLEELVRIGDIDTKVRVKSADAPKPFAGAGAITDDTELRRDYERLRIAHELTRAIGSTTELEPLLRTVLACLVRELEADQAAVLLANTRTGALEPRAVQTEGDHPLAISSTIVEQVAADRVGVVSADAGMDRRFSGAGSVRKGRIRSALCVPLVYGDDLLGVLYLATFARSDAYDTETLALARLLADQLATAIRGATAGDVIRRVEQAQRARLQALVRHLPVALLVLSPDAKVTLANAEAHRMLDGLVTFAEGAAIDQLGPLTIPELLARRREGAIEIRFPGHPERVLVATTARIGAGSAHAGEIVVALRDVTELRERKRQSELQERLAVLGRLLGGVAHDFNNVLAIINGACGMAQSVLPREAEAQEFLAQVHEAADRAAELVRRLLGFGRGDPLRPQILEVDSVLHEMRDMLERVAGESVSLAIVQPEGRLGGVFLDRARFEQAILNLVVNAHDAMPDGGALRITVSGRTTPELPAPEQAPVPDAPFWVRVEVADTGTGMPDAVRRHALEPFFSTKGPGKGTGLGLASVAELVTEVGGRIAIESLEGAGTTIIMELPGVAPVSESGRVRRRPSDLRGDGRHVLVLEDEGPVRAVTRAILSRAGYTVTDVESMRQARAVLEAEEPVIDLLLADVALPDGSGPALAGLLPPHRSGLPVVYVTGYPADRLSAFGLQADQSNLLHKPVAEGLLLRTLRDTIDAAAAGGA